MASKGLIRTAGRGLAVKGVEFVVVPGDERK